jgi:hypothetical protein
MEFEAFRQQMQIGKENAATRGGSLNRGQSFGLPWRAEDLDPVVAVVKTDADFRE